MKTIRYNLKNAEEIIKETTKVLKNGGLVIFPSDTVYGALVDATNKKSVKKLLAFKNRPPGKPISVFVADFRSLNSQVQVGKKQENLLKQLLPGPFTVILASHHKVNRLIESEKGTLGVRIPLYPLVNKLSRTFGRPLTATSANRSGGSPHYSTNTLLADLSNKQKSLIDLVVDAGTLPRNKPSTIIDLTQPQVRLLRRGDIIFDRSKTYVSESPSQTEKVGGFIVEKYYDPSEKKPLVFIIEGELGVGKTKLIQGMGKKLGIDNIISPTFVIYYEYGNFYHFDLYQIEDSEEFKHLGIKKLLRPGKILCFEWGEKIGEIYELLKSKAKIIYIKMKYVSEKNREILISDQL